MFPGQQQQQQQQMKMNVAYGYRYYTEDAQNHPLLDWNQYVIGSNFHEARIKSVHGLLHSQPMNMSTPEFFLHFLSSRSDFSASRTKFMKNQKKICELMSLIAQDKDGRKNLDFWLRREGYATDIVCEDIGEEMELVKPSMKSFTRDLTAEGVKGFDFNKEIVEVLDSRAPTLSRVLYSAAHDQSSAESTRKKPPRFVSDN